MFCAFLWRHIFICFYKVQSKGSLHATHGIAVLQVSIEKIEDRFVRANLVRLLREPVAFVVKQNVLDNTVALLDVLDDLI